MSNVSSGDIVVVKIGGSTLSAEDSTNADLLELQHRGLHPVVVHGGGATISEWVRRQGIQPEFVRGLRRTDPATLEVAVAVLCGLVNAQIVADLVGRGGRAVGLSGVSGPILKARVLDPELGLVGKIAEVDPAPILAVLESGAVPVIAPAAYNAGAARSGDRILNVNADTSAGHIARALACSRIVFQTDVPGVLDVNRRLIPRMTKRQASDLIAGGIASGGMIPKIEACLEALKTVRSGHIIDGRHEGALLACVEGQDIGTRIV